MTRAALYLRISKDDARTGLAVERQQGECLALIAREGLSLVETYTDNGVSAYARNVRRPEFDRMSADYERGKFDVVVCWDLDRFSRQPKQLETWIEAGEDRGLRIITPTEVTDLGTDNGRMFARMKATIARAEVERKSARQRAQVAQAKSSGTFRGRVGFDDVEVIRRIFAEVIDGRGTYQIARDLNAEGGRTLTGITWSAQAVRRVAMTTRHRGGAVTADDYDAAQTILTPKARVGAKARGLYSGVARCTCGAAMTASGDRYTCAFATNHPGSKGHQTVARTKLEAAITQGVYRALLERPQSAGGDLRALRVAKAEAADAVERAVQAQAEARTDVGRDAARRAVARAEDAYEAADAALAEAMTARAGEGVIEATREALAVEVAGARLAHPSTVGTVSTGEALEALEDVQAVREAWGRVWGALDIDRRRELARGLVTAEVLPYAGPNAERVTVTPR